MRYVRWFAIIFFAAGFAATFTRYHYLWVGLWALGMFCLLIWIRRERA